LDFSVDDELLQMCAQKVDPIEHIRDYSEKEFIYVTWHIRDGELVNSTATLRDTKWPSWSLSNSIYARFLGT